MGRAIILLDERLLLHLLSLPEGTRVLSSMNHPMYQGVAVQVESDALPDSDPYCELPVLHQVQMRWDANGAPAIHWPELEAKE